MGGGRVHSGLVRAHRLTERSYAHHNNQFNSNMSVTIATTFTGLGTSERRQTLRLWCEGSPGQVCVLPPGWTSCPCLILPQCDSRQAAGGSSAEPLTCWLLSCDVISSPPIGQILKMIRIHPPTSSQRRAGTASHTPDMITQMNG